VTESPTRASPVLFLVQTLVGAAAEHYRADISSFFGFDLAAWLPYNLARLGSLPETKGARKMPPARKAAAVQNNAN
jgi:hypothetical protein